MAVAVLICGAGVGGLATLHTLTRHGFSVLCIEGSRQIGGRFGNQHLAGPGNTVPRKMLELPGFPLARAQAYGTSPGSADAGGLTYLQAFVDHHGLAAHIRLQHQITSLQRTSDGLWLAVITDLSTGQVHKLSAGFVVLATGRSGTTPYIPVVPGQATFQGLQVHSRNLSDPSMIRGQSVLVVGEGQAAAEYAAQLSVTGSLKQIMCISGEEDKLYLPRTLAGVGVEQVALNRLTTCLLPPYYSAGLLARAGHMLAAPFKMAAWACAGSALRRELDPNGRNKPLPLPKSLFQSSSQLANPTLPLLLMHGRVKVIKSSVDYFTPEGAVLANGSHVTADVVIYATGMHNTYDYLEAGVRERLRLHEDGAYLYRHIVHPDIPNLAFIGSEVSTFTYPLTSALQAEWLLELLSGRLVLPPVARMHQDLARQEEWKHEVMPPHRGRAATLLLYAQTYHDQLLSDMGISPQRKGWRFWKECCGAYTAHDYADIVCYSAPQTPMYDQQALQQLKAQELGQSVMNAMSEQQKEDGYSHDMQVQMQMLHAPGGAAHGLALPAEGRRMSDTGHEHTSPFTGVAQLQLAEADRLSMHSHDSGTEPATSSSAFFASRPCSSTAHSNLAPGESDRKAASSCLHATSDVGFSTEAVAAHLYRQAGEQGSGLVHVESLVRNQHTGMFGPDEAALAGLKRPNGAAATAPAVAPSIPAAATAAGLMHTSTSPPSSAPIQEPAMRGPAPEQSSPQASSAPQVSGIASAAMLTAAAAASAGVRNTQHSTSGHGGISNLNSAAASPRFSGAETPDRNRSNDCISVSDLDDMSEAGAERDFKDSPGSQILSGAATPMRACSRAGSGFFDKNGPGGQAPRAMSAVASLISRMRGKPGAGGSVRGGDAGGGTSASGPTNANTSRDSSHTGIGSPHSPALRLGSTFKQSPPGAGQSSPGIAGRPHLSVAMRAIRDKGAKSKSFSVGALTASEMQAEPRSTSNAALQGAAPGSPSLHTANDLIVSRHLQQGIASGSAASTMAVLRQQGLAPGGSSHYSHRSTSRQFALTSQADVMDTDVLSINTGSDASLLLPSGSDYAAMALSNGGRRSTAPYPNSPAIAGVTSRGSSSTHQGFFLGSPHMQLGSSSSGTQLPHHSHTTGEEGLGLGATAGSSPQQLPADAQQGGGTPSGRRIRTFASDSGRSSSNLGPARAAVRTTPSNSHVSPQLMRTTSLSAVRPGSGAMAHGVFDKALLQYDQQQQAQHLPSSREGSARGISPVSHPGLAPYSRVDYELAVSHEGTRASPPSGASGTMRDSPVGLNGKAQGEAPAAAAFAGSSTPSASAMLAVAADSFMQRQMAAPQESSPARALHQQASMASSVSFGWSHSQTHAQLQPATRQSGASGAFEYVSPPATSQAQVTLTSSQDDENVRASLPQAALYNSAADDASDNTEGIPLQMFNRPSLLPAHALPMACELPNAPPASAPGMLRGSQRRISVHASIGHGRSIASGANASPQFFVPLSSLEIMADNSSGMASDTGRASASGMVDNPLSLGGSVRSAVKRRSVRRNMSQGNLRNVAAPTTGKAAVRAQAATLDRIVAEASELIRQRRWGVSGQDSRRASSIMMSSCEFGSGIMGSMTQEGLALAAAAAAGPGAQASGPMSQGIEVFSASLSTGPTAASASGSSAAVMLLRFQQQQQQPQMAPAQSAAASSQQTRAYGHSLSAQGYMVGAPVSSTSNTGMTSGTTTGTGGFTAGPSTSGQMQQMQMPMQMQMQMQGQASEPHGSFYAAADNTPNVLAAAGMQPPRTLGPIRVHSGGQQHHIQLQHHQQQLLRTAQQAVPSPRQLHHTTSDITGATNWERTDSGHLTVRPSWVAPPLPRTSQSITPGSDVSGPSSAADGCFTPNSRPSSLSHLGSSRSHKTLLDPQGMALSQQQQQQMLQLSPQNSMHRLSNSNLGLLCDLPLDPAALTRLRRASTGDPAALQAVGLPLPAVQLLSRASSSKKRMGGSGDGGIVGGSSAGGASPVLVPGGAVAPSSGTVRRRGSLPTTEELAAAAAMLMQQQPRSLPGVSGSGVAPGPGSGTGLSSAGGGGATGSAGGAPSDDTCSPDGRLLAPGSRLLWNNGGSGRDVLGIAVTSPLAAAAGVFASGSRSAAVPVPSGGGGVPPGMQGGASGVVGAVPAPMMLAMAPDQLELVMQAGMAQGDVGQGVDLVALGSSFQADIPLESIPE